MKNNVVIKHYKKRQLVEVRELHNIWTSVGHTYLAEMVSLTSLDPDVPIRSDRLKYFALGMGGTRGGVSVDPTVAATYPAGSDPNATAGNEYNVAFPGYPPITTLELPVKRTGGATAYPGAPSDEWLFGPTEGVFTTRYEDDISLTLHAPIDTSGGDITGIWGPVHVVPITEAALLTSAADVNTAYNEVLAYISFDSIYLDDDTQLEFVWTVRFLE